LFIHNAWTCACGNANDFRKQADDLDTITQASINAYMQHVNITEDKLKELLDEETWLLPSDALEMGFATSIVGKKATEKAAASARKALFSLVKNARVTADPEPAAGPNQTAEPTPQQAPEPDPEPELSKENKPIKF